MAVTKSLRHTRQKFVLAIGLRSFALGAYDLFAHIYDIEFIKMHIHQPRIDNVTSWEITVENAPSEPTLANGVVELELCHSCRFAD